jgi:hypothetical protein
MLAEATGWLENYRRLWEATFIKLDDLLEVMKASDTQPTTPSDSEEATNG